MKRISQDTKLTIQVIIAIILILAGLTLLFLGFHTPPIGQIHDSVLIAYGESSTFAGALLGIDYTYKYKMFIAGKNDDRHENEEDGNNN